MYGWDRGAQGCDEGLILINNPSYHSGSFSCIDAAVLEKLSKGTKYWPFQDLCVFAQAVLAMHTVSELHSVSEKLKM